MFRSVKAKNFLSWKDLNFTFETGLSLIDGYNHDDGRSEGCHGKDTPILMYDGTIKMVQDVKVGDKLAGPDSKPRNVLKLCRGNGLMYKITPTKGEPFIVNDEHILSFRMSSTINRENYKKGQIINITVKDYINKNERFKQDAMLYRVPQNFRKKTLEIDPYIFGVWLGDGHSKGTSITSMDQEIVNEWINYGKELNLKINIWSKLNNKAKTYNITTGTRKGKHGKNILFNKLKKYKVINNKHIPYDYLTSSREQRLQLLAGLIDSDGHLSCNGYKITQKNDKLANDILYLARSLGFAAYNKKCKKKSQNNTEGVYNRISISGDLSLVPVRLERKKAKPRKQVKNVLHTGMKLESIGIGDYYGFQLDKDHLYLLGDFTVTHNSGKSAVFEALVFGLFGKTSRNVKIDEVIHEGSESCIVRIDLHDDSYIIRSRNPNDLYIVFSDRRDTFVRGKDIKETQKIIEKHIGFTFDTFCQAVYFPQNYGKKFIIASEEERAKILSDIQNLNVYDKARKEVSDKLKKLNKHLEASEFQLKSLQSSLNQYNEEKNRIDQLIKSFENQKGLKLHNIKKEINAIEEEKLKIETEMMSVAANVSKAEVDELDKSIADLQKSIQELEFNQTEVQKNKGLKYTIRKQIESETERREEYMQALATREGECPTCGSTLNAENEIYSNYLKEIEAAISKINNNINNLTKQEQDLLVYDDKTYQEKLLEHKNDLEYLEQKRGSYNSILTQITAFQDKIKDCDVRKQYKVDAYNSVQFEDCEDLKKTFTDIESKVKEVGIQLGTAQVDYNTIKEEYDILETLKSGFREIKSYVFKGLLSELNKNANKAILELFQQDVRLEYYNEGEEGEISKIKVKIHLDGKERSIGLLSGGQFRRAQIASDLALGQLMYNRSNKLLNLQIFDEAFKDLSETTVYNILELLQKQNGTIVLIEHNSVIKNSIDKKYHVELKNGVSQWV